MYVCTCILYYTVLSKYIFSLQRLTGACIPFSCYITQYPHKWWKVYVFVSICVIYIKKIITKLSYSFICRFHSHIKLTCLVISFHISRFFFGGFFLKANLDLTIWSKRVTIILFFVFKFCVCQLHRFF